MTETNNLAAALAEFQRKLPQIKKSETAQVRSDKGNYSYTYADLADVSAQVMPLLGECGLSFSARPTASQSGALVLAYELLHTSGESRSGEYPLPTGGTPQQLGSAITYGRRYCLCAVTGVAPDDDDDGAAAQTQQPQSRKRDDGLSAQSIADEAKDPAITRDVLRTLYRRGHERGLLGAEVASPDTGVTTALADYLAERAQVAADNDAEAQAEQAQDGEDQAATDEAAAEAVAEAGGEQ